MENKEVIGFVVDINGKRQYKTTFEKNGYKQEIWVNLQKINNISNSQLTEKGGFSNPTIISRLKAGKHAFQIDTIYRICLGLGCKSSEILPF